MFKRGLILTFLAPAGAAMPMRILSTSKPLGASLEEGNFPWIKLQVSQWGFSIPCQLFSWCRFEKLYARPSGPIWNSGCNGTALCHIYPLLRWFLPCSTILLPPSFNPLPAPPTLKLLNTSQQCLFYPNSGSNWPSFWVLQTWFTALVLRNFRIGPWVPV